MIVKSQNLLKDNRKNDSKALNEELNVIPLKLKQNAIFEERSKIPKIINIDEIFINDNDEELFKNCSAAKLSA